MSEERMRLLLAYGVSVYATALQGMEALRDAGEAVGYTTIGQVRRSLHEFAARWDALHGNPLWRDERLALVITEARDYCTIHQSEIDELTSRE